MIGGEDVSEVVVSLLEDPLLTAGAEWQGERRSLFGRSLEFRDTPVDQSHHLQLAGREGERERGDTQ